MNKIATRPAAVAGYFYPDNAQELQLAVRGYLNEAAAKQGDTGPDWPKAIIAPHAGYVYSGAVAASVYHRLKPGRGKIQKVVLIGPAHRMAVRGLAVPSVAAFDSPLGPVAIDQSKILQLQTSFGFVVSSDASHAREHSLEVHLPFLQEVLGDFQLIPICAGAATPQQVFEVLDFLWGGEETQIVISSDLSHYLDYDAAKKIDSKTCSAIENLDPNAIDDDGACGRLPIKGLLMQAQKRDLHAVTVDIRNSGDTAGTKDRVVGYGAWVFEPNTKSQLPDVARNDLIRAAVATIQRAAHNMAPPEVRTETFHPSIQAHRGAFVTLNRNGRLRGCIGSLVGYQPLVQDVVVNAHKSSVADPRFPKLTSEELDNLEIEISVLSPQTPMLVADKADLFRQLRPTIDGLVLTDNNHRALFLPSVWEQIPDPEQFLGHLLVKAGLAAHHWSPTLRFFRFTVEKFGTKLVAKKA